MLMLSGNNINFSAYVICGDVSEVKAIGNTDSSNHHMCPSIAYSGIITFMIWCVHLFKLFQFGFE